MMPTFMPFESYHTYYCARCKRLNSTLYSKFLSEQNHASVVKSHFFEGRYENIYIARERIPALAPILAQAKTIAAEITGKPAHQLKIGFWFNAMQPGDVTLPHCHDNDDEWLSAVYYIQTSIHCGALILQLGEGVTEEIIPIAGSFVFFSPKVLHHVDKNQSNALRLSLGMNIGPVE